MTISNILVILLGFYCNHIIFSLIGVLIIDHYDLGVGDIIFDLKLTLRKMAWFSALVLLIPLLVFWFTHAVHSTAFLYVLILVIGLKSIYLNITGSEIVTLTVCNVIGLGLFGTMIRSSTGLYLYISAVIIIMVLLMVRVLHRSWVVWQQKRFEGQRKAEIVETVAQNPDFQTFCFTCKYYDNHEEECFRKQNRLAVREMYLKGNRAYCLYWVATTQYANKSLE